jgi:Zn-dependent peptidase ImmA (M78 family)
MNRSREWGKLPEERQKLIERLQIDAKVPLGEIAKSLGLKVLLSTLPANVSGEIRADKEVEAGFTIRINRHESKARQRFTLAHEISHYLLHEKSIGSGISDNVLYRSSLSDKQEAEANRLAADLIMPWSILQSQARSRSELDEAKIEEIANRLGVSVVALKIRVGIN